MSSPVNYFGYIGSETGGTYFAPADGTYSRLPPRSGFQANTGLNGWQKLADAESLDTKTVTHDFLADLNNTFALSKEREEALANGEDVYVLADWLATQGAPAGGRWYWKIKKV
jgi:hypothetical protein